MTSPSDSGAPLPSSTPESFDSVLEALGAKPVPPELFEPFLREMEERVIPEIEAYQHEQAVLAEETRRWVLR